MATISKTYGSVTRLYNVDPIKVGVVAGRKASSLAEVEHAIAAHGLVAGTQDWHDAVRAAKTAMRLTAEKLARPSGCPEAPQL